jgi:hypothetical protein
MIKESKWEASIPEEEVAISEGARIPDGEA